MDFFFH
jgi:beta-amyrin synthase